MIQGGSNFLGAIIKNKSASVLTLPWLHPTAQLSKMCAQSFVFSVYFIESPITPRYVAVITEGDIREVGAWFAGSMKDCDWQVFERIHFYSCIMAPPSKGSIANTLFQSRLSHHRRMLHPSLPHNWLVTRFPTTVFYLSECSKDERSDWKTIGYLY